MPSLNRTPNEKELEKLVSIYLRAETAIINEIGRLRSQGLVDYHAVAALERVQAILRQMESDCWEYVPKMIEKQFYVRVPEARKALEVPETAAKHAAGYANAAVLTGEQHAIVGRLAANLMGEITDASMTVMATLQSALFGRVEPDIYRRVGLEQVAAQQAAGRGVNASVPSFVQALRREGVRAFTDKAGRDWSLHTYCTMVSRTTSRQAEVLAVLTADPEHDLYMISSHGTTCALCAPYGGRVYSRSGTDPDFPPLAAAFGKVDPAGPDTLANTWLNIHPNCLHVLLPWTAAGRTDEEIQKIKDFSNPSKNPFSRDPRSESQIAAYRKKERARAQWLADYRQWERYRVTLGDRVPGRFETFLHQKREDGERYRLWRLDYRRRAELLEHPERALPGADKASAADAKFTGYFFNPENPKGLAKGRAFSSHLGYNVENWQIMRDEILEAAKMYPVTYRSSSIYGKLYSQLVILQGVNNKPANVLLGWIVKPDGSTWLTTAHMEEF
ncbi:phage minor capsid protein [Flavonifractor plautii]|jgi:hypothetical protein|uniref:phage minor capsid protein n=1 Tax=Flavonifractor plautii TaxID=292800 RepID=UPI0012ABC7FE|nr:phage minor capsid protein [Flavonifractor plautii]